MLHDTMSDRDVAEQTIDNSEDPVLVAMAWRLLAAVKKIEELENDKTMTNAVRVLGSPIHDA